MAKATKSGSGTSSKSQSSEGSASETAKAKTSSASKASASSSKSTSSKAAAAKSTTTRTSAAAKDTKPSAATQAAKAKTDAAKTAKDTVSSSKASETKPVADSKAAPEKAAEAKPSDATVKSEAKDKAPETPAAAKTDKPSTATTATTTKPDAKPAETKPAPTTSTPPPSTAPQKQRGSVFWPLVFGGVIAGVLGYAASEMDVLNTRADLSGFEDRIAEQQDRIAALENAEAPVSEAPDLSGIEASIAVLSDQVSVLEAELQELARRPVPTSGGSAPAVDYSADFDEMRASIAAQQEEISAQQDEIARLLENAQSVEEATAEAARQAAAQAALAKITAAVSTGSSYDDALSELQEAGVNDVSGALADPAGEGVPTLTQLQSGFPDAARAALAAARSTGAEGDETGFGSFLRRQLGARSTAPREGSDPDAVLSRAEAAVRDGRISAALDELDTLPEEAQAAMDDWLTRARTRADAEAAVQDLTQRLTAN